MDKTIKRGDIYYADLNPVVGSEQGGTRPVLVISNDIGNRHSPIGFPRLIFFLISASVCRPHPQRLDASDGILPLEPTR